MKEAKQSEDKIKAGYEKKRQNLNIISGKKLVESSKPKVNVEKREKTAKKVTRNGPEVD